MANDVAEVTWSASASAPEPARPRPRLRWWWAVALAVAAGLVLLLAFPPYDAWWTAPIGVAMLALATHRRGFWAGAGLGTLAGLALLIPLLSWAGGYIGAVWLFLPFGFAPYFGLMGAIAARLTPVVQRWRWTWPLATGSVWVLQEALRSRTPFGGFPWGRLAFSQADSPLLALAGLGGAPLVSFAVAALGGLLAAAAVSVPAAAAWDTLLRDTSARDTSARGNWRSAGTALVPAAVALALVWTPLLLPAPRPGEASQTYQVAIVQGNVPRLGLDFNAQRRAVLENHVRATIQLAQDVAAGRRPQPALVVWPENASDVDPILDRLANQRINEAAARIGVPILVGGLLRGPGEKDVRNVGIVWDPRTGPGQIYAKRHPVPFAEYIPLRPLVRMITDKVDLVRTDFVAGDAPGVLSVPGVVVGDVICFEVAYDGVVRDTITNGAQLLVVQTNNATFDEAEARQQLAMVRVRAVEHGRAALMASTVGISAFVDAEGRVYDSTRFNEPAVITRAVTLSNTRTTATTLGPLPELALVAAALALLALAVVLKRRTAAAGKELSVANREVVG